MVPAMFDLPTLDLPAPHAATTEIERNKRSRGTSGRAIAIGTILILSDGSECVFAGYDDQGNPLCYPVEN